VVAMSAQKKRPVSMMPVRDFTDDDFDLDKDEVKMGEILGKGAFSTVYKATYKGVTVAVKKQSVKDKDLEKYIRKELGILKRVDHPSLVKYVGACKLDNQTLYIATEYCMGGDLRRLLQSKKQLGWKFRVGVARGIAEGITYLHERDLIHRDIKTENVLLDEFMSPKLCDFGFARNTDGAYMTPKGRPMTMLGTDEFMAPEIIFGMEYNAKADIFGLGIVFAEMVARKIPGKEHAFLERHPMSGFTVDKDELQALDKEYSPPDSFLRLVVECCGDNPDNRPSAEDVFDWLDDMMNELPDDKIPKPTLTEEEMLQAVKVDLDNRSKGGTQSEIDDDDLAAKPTTQEEEEELTMVAQLAWEYGDEVPADVEDAGDDEPGAKIEIPPDASDLAKRNAQMMDMLKKNSAAKMKELAESGKPDGAARSLASGARAARKKTLARHPKSEQYHSMSGYVSKRGGRIKTWKKRFMITSVKGLLYFKTKADFESKPQIIQGSILYGEMIAPKGKTQVAERVGFVVTGRQHSFRVMTKTRPRFFHTDNERLADRWVRSINLAHSTWALEQNKKKK